MGMSVYASARVNIMQLRIVRVYSLYCMRIYHFCICSDEQLFPPEVYNPICIHNHITNIIISDYKNYIMTFWDTNCLDAMTRLDWTIGLPLELKVQHYSSILELTGAITSFT